MIVPKWLGTNIILIDTLGAVLSLRCCLCGTLGDPFGVMIVVFTGINQSVISVWKMLVNYCIILFVASLLRNGIRSCGCLNAEDISFKAAIIMSS